MFKRFGPYLKPYTRYCIIGPLFKLIEAILELYLPLLMAHVIDRGLAGGDRAYVTRMGFVMVGIVAFGLCSALICQYVASITSQGFGTELRNVLFRHITKLSHTDLDRFGTASLINRVTADVNQLQYAVAMLIRLVIRAPFLCIGGVIMAMTINLTLSLVIIVAIPLLVLLIWLVMKFTVPLHRAVQKRLDTLSRVVRENLSGVRVIRAFARTERERTRFDDATEQHTAAAIRVGRLAAVLNPATTLIMNIAILCIIWFGGIQVKSDSMTAGEIIAFINYVNQILVALTVVANLVVTFTKTVASAGRISDVLDTPPAPNGLPESPAPVAGAPRLAFDHVSFSYGGGDRELTDISFAVPAGGVVGIIGGTGAGKSTLIRLLMRFYDATEGMVLLDGVDVRQYPTDALRARMGLVSQKIELFSGSIADNIRWGKQDATDEDVQEAARMAQADEFIRAKADGYQTQVERGGANLSGGQRQRLSIARALVRKPDILILDDASSALDYATDASLRRALRAASHNMTVLTVSQRVSAVRDADLILVMDDGQLAGCGTHEQLRAECPVYAEICESQERGVEQ